MCYLIEALVEFFGQLDGMCIFLEVDSVYAIGEIARCRLLAFMAVTLESDDDADTAHVCREQ